MTLSDLIGSRFGGSQRRFAKAAAINEGQLSKYLQAERGDPEGQRPGADSIAKIEAATDGAITAAHWHSLRRLLPRRNGHGRSPPPAAATAPRTQRTRTRRHPSNPTPPGEPNGE